MSTTPTSDQSSLHWPVRRDRWDTIDFYLLFFSSMLITGTALIIQATITLSQSPANLWGWFSLIQGIGAFAFGTWLVICNIWQRYAEEYVMTPEALIFEYGWRQVRVPWDDIAALHPIKVCRTTTALKPAHRINFRKPVGLVRAADAYPINSEGFLEELTNRCPHLERDGARMSPHLSNKLASGATSGRR